MNCQRCSATREGTAIARINSELLDLQVCERCAREAADLGLPVEPLLPFVRDKDTECLSEAA